ncbi:MAG: hypothetical protein GX133_09075 [Syntrophomonadaceae bacterium]|nr:hypothetical protein [Syntrophomonadaceae bacterium]
MLAIFASGAGGEGLFYNPVVLLLSVLVAICIFVKFCGWAKGFQLSGSLKKWVFILTGVGLVFFNVLYSMGNKQILASGDWSGATIAVLASLAWILVFSFVLMAETKTQS